MLTRVTVWFASNTHFDVAQHSRAQKHRKQVTDGSDGEREKERLVPSPDPPPQRWPSRRGSVRASPAAGSRPPQPSPPHRRLPGLPSIATTSRSAAELVFNPPPPHGLLLIRPLYLPLLRPWVPRGGEEGVEVGGSHPHPRLSRHICFLTCFLPLFGRLLMVVWLSWCTRGRRFGCIRTMCRMALGAGSSYLLDSQMWMIRIVIWYVLELSISS